MQWDNISDEFKESLIKEIIEDKMYEKYVQVEEGDIVFDIGASMGIFTNSILPYNPAHVFAIEPSFKVFQTLVLNTRHAQVTCINKAVSSNIGEFKSGYIFNNDEKVYSTTFMQIVKDYNIQKIDFLKTDCEGGEYDIFTPENLIWIKQNVRKIVGEWHFDDIEKFRAFRDTYLRLFPDHKIYSLDNYDITWGLWQEEFIHYYDQVIVHINNKKAGY